jgi:hypothetical protein
MYQPEVRIYGVLSAIVLPGQRYEHDQPLAVLKALGYDRGYAGIGPILKSAHLSAMEIAVGLVVSFESYGTRLFGFPTAQELYKETLFMDRAIVIWTLLESQVRSCPGYIDPERWLVMRDFF